MALQGGPHRVEIVLAEEEHRELPQSGKVHRLVELALGHRPVSEEAGGDPIAGEHLVGQRQPDCQRDAPSHDGIAAVQPGGGVEQVHGAAAATTAAFDPPEHLGHDRAGVHAAHKGMAMLPVGRDDGVVRYQRIEDADRHRFLTDV